MKKTLTANISGTVFHIEEDAYEKLQRYLSSIRGQFSSIEGRDEIMGDIEARIAELFQERMAGKRQVVNVDDVDHVIGIMGQPEDYMGEGEENASANSAQKEPNWTSGGERKHRRLMRDTEDKWVGGVLSGVASYFGFDPLILRLIYIALLFMGVGVLLYIILWIVVPPAETAADRLYMRGEPVNVDSIKRMFDEGSERFKSGAERVANEASNIGRNWSRSGPGSGRDHFSRTASRGVGILGKIIGIALLFFGCIGAMVLIGVTAGLTTFTYDHIAGGTDSDYFELGNLFFNSPSQGFWMAVCSVLVALIPIIAIVLVGLRLVFNTHTPQWLKITLPIAWFVAFVTVMVLGIRLGSDFKRSEKVRAEVQLLQPQGQVLYLNSLTNNDASDKHWNINYKNGQIFWDGDLFHTTADSVHGAWAQMDIERSPDGNYHLIVVRKAQAHSMKASITRASNITYTVSQTDSLVVLSPWVNFPKADKIRAQRIRYIVQVPFGKAVNIGGNMGFMLDDVDNVTNTYDGDMVNQTWTMTSGGLSKDVNPNDIPDNLNQPTPAGPDSTKKTVVSLGGNKWELDQLSNAPVEQTSSSWSEPTLKMPNVLELLFQRIPV